MAETISTPLTRRLGIKYPIILAGMNGVSHHELAAAVTNAGGLGVIGGLSFTPKMLRKEIQELKALLNDPNAPFGVDLALPQVGGNARKTNHDYTHGKLPELVDIIIEEGAKLFVSAVGVPPKWLVEKMHNAGIVLMNMCGDPHHVEKAVELGMDAVCAQGTEAGGHTGAIGTMALVPQCVEKARGCRSPLDGGPVYVVAAGGIGDGATMAAALSLGASAVWVGTRFVASVESAAPQRHKEAVVRSLAKDTLRTLVYSGRPLRLGRTPYVNEWETKRQNEIKELCDQGIVPFKHDFDKASEEGSKFDLVSALPLLFGQGCGSIHDIKSAKDIVEGMVADCIATMRSTSSMISKI